MVYTRSDINQYNIFSYGLSALAYIRDPKESGNMTLIGNWDEKGRVLECKTMSLFPKTRLSDLYGKTLRSSSFEYKPYTYIVGDAVDDKGDPLYDGVEVSLNIWFY